MKKLLDKIHVPNWVVLILALVVILRIPSFFEPYYYGDEMIYLSLGEGIKKGLVLYSQIHDNKPPLIYLLAGLAGNIFWFKAILTFWSLGTIILFYNLAKALFPGKERLHKIALTIFALLTTLPLLEGNIVNSEILMIGLTIAGFLILLTQKLDFKNIFTAGIFLGLSALLKIPAAFDLPAIIFFWLIQSNFKKEELKVIFKRILYLSLGFALPLLITFIYFFLQGALKDYWVAAFLQNVGYLSSWRPGDVQKSFLIRNLPLLIRSLILILGLGALSFSRKKISRQFLLLCSWVLFGLFAVTLSERPYPHYLIQVVPEVSFFLALFLAERSLEQSLSILPLALVFFVPFYYKYWHYSTLAYYQKFLSFVGRKTTKEEYFASFSQNTNSNYELANFLTSSTKPTDPIYVWGEESPVIYALAKRLPPNKYVATYHVLDYSTREAEVQKLEKEKPVFIIILPQAPSFPEIIPLLRKNYFQLLTFKNTEVWRLKTF